MARPLLVSGLCLRVWKVPERRGLGWGLGLSRQPCPRGGGGA